MAGTVESTPHRVPTPALATTYEGMDSDLFQQVLPLVDYLEIAPDSISRTSNGHAGALRPELLDQIASATPHTGLIVHGIGLSIGTADGWNSSYIRLLDEFFSRFTPRWHSEHLGYTTVDGENLDTMLSLPRTEEMLDLLCERIRILQERYKVPFLVEHIIHLLPDAPAEYTPAAFLNALTSRTGCGLILDAYNLECDAHNFGFDIPSFLDELNLHPVREMHLAGGFEHHGFQLDIHSRPTADSTIALAHRILARCPNLEVVTWELLKEAAPALGASITCAELTRIRAEIANIPAELASC
ncbi:DUF692 domain-containing protein [Terracidiphilus gabretensis]|uniref:DUF692 domain-containing protein n=1 Tax=Terracidiphilus gabretensis TaxID=1577687 RepID=UPI00071BB2B1|nr:DUF692 family multinuclear iron-containing protein [Terracidiphilus gabretensis]